jgi:predicted DNA-binding transcriptional regulator AlpA
MLSALTDDELAQGGYRFEDLQALRVVKNRTDLNRKQSELGFPRPVKTGKSQALFLKAEVHAWLAARALLRDNRIANK